MSIVRNLLVAASMTVVTTIGFGVAYPLAVAAVAQFLFPDQANGQLVRRDGRSVGSRLIGQAFTAPKYFHSRPSYAGADGYDASASGGSNLGPTSKKLADAVARRVREARLDNPGAAVPIDLVTASASGLDPHISPDAAVFQVPRVARVRQVSESALRQLIIEFTEPRQLGFLGERRVNVLELNLALDERWPARN